MRYLRDDVVKALDVLNVNSAVHVDAAVQQFLNVEIALRVAAAGRIGMRKLIDERDLRAPRNDRLEVHLLEMLAAIFDGAAGDDLESFEQSLRLPAAMGLDDAYDNIIPVLSTGLCLLQHLIGLADAGRGAHENLEFTVAAFLASRRFEQGFRRRTLAGLALLIRHSRS